MIKITRTRWEVGKFTGSEETETKDFWNLISILLRNFNFSNKENEDDAGTFKLKILEEKAKNLLSERPDDARVAGELYLELCGFMGGEFLKYDKELVIATIRLDWTKPEQDSIIAFTVEDDDCKATDPPSAEVIEEMLELANSIFNSKDTEE